jgi:predicted small lipoprotein YifL
MRSSIVVAALGGLLILAGCGIKGDLYIPEVPQLEPRDAPASPTPADTPAAPPPASADGDDNNLAPLQPR